MDLDQIRQQYPQYDSMGDQQLADALHQKYYANMPVDQFYQKIGFTPKETIGQQFEEGAKNLVHSLQQSTPGQALENLSDKATGFLSTALSGGNPDVQAHIAAQLSQYALADTPFATKWADEYRAAESELANAHDPRLKDSISQRISALEKTNPYNLGKQMADSMAATEAMPKVVQGLTTTAQTSLDDFISDPLGSLKSTAKSGVEYAQEISKHPIASAGTGLGTLLDPTYWVGPGEAMAVKKSLGHFVTDVTSGTVKMVGIGAANTALNLQSQQGYASTDDIVKSISGNVTPMLVANSFFGGIGLARGAGKETPGTEAPPAANLDTPAKIVQNHFDTFHELLNTDDVTSAVGNIAQKMNKNPETPLSPIEELKSLSDDLEAQPKQGVEAPIRPQETTSPETGTGVAGQEQEPPEPIKGVTAENFDRDAQETALWNKANRTGDQKDIDAARDYSAQLEARARRARFQGGAISKGQLAAVGLGAAGAIYGYKEYGAGGAAVLGALGVAAPIASGMLLRGARAFLANDSLIKPQETLNSMVEHLRQSQMLPLQLANQFRKIITPEQSQRINAALHGTIPFEDLTPIEREGYSAGRAIYDKYGEAMKQQGIIGEMKTDYVSRLFQPRADMPEDFKNTWRTNLSPSRVRRLADGAKGLQQAYDMGLELKYSKFEDNIANYAATAQRLLAKQAAIKSLLTTGLDDEHRWVMPSNEAPRNYVEVGGTRTISSVLRTVNALAGKGQKISPSTEFRAHPDIAPYFNMLFDDSTPWRASRWYDGLNLALKNSKLSFSLFHSKTLTQHHMNLQDWGLANVKGYTDIPSIVDGTHPIYQAFYNQDPITQLALKHGLVVTPAEEWDHVTNMTNDTEFDKWFDANVPEDMRLKVPGSAYEMYKASETAFKRLTFGRFMTAYKLMDAVSLFNKEKARDTLRAASNTDYRIRSDDEVMKGVTTLLNNAYGAQDYWKMMIDTKGEAMRRTKAFIFSPLGRRITQRALLAPDWLISTTRAMTHAFPALWSKSDVARLHANYMFKSAFYYLLAGNMINLMNTGHTMASNKDPLTVELGGGRTLLLDKAFTDPIKLGTAPWKTMLSKAAPIPAEFMDQVANQSYLTPYGTAPKITSSKDTLDEELVHRGAHVMQNTLPIAAEQLFINPITGKPGIAPGTALSGFLGMPIYSHKEKAVYY